MITLAKALQVETVVEWVEDEHTAALLTDWGVDYMQGFGFGHAVDETAWDEPDVSSEQLKAG